MSTLTSPTLTKIVFNVRNLLNQPNPANSFWSDAELIEYINEGIRMYFAEIVLHNEGQFTTQADLDLVANTDTVALPADFFELRLLYKKVNSGYEALAYANNVTSGYSTQGGTSANSYLPYYYFRDNNLVLRPVPNFSETGGLRIEYIRFPDTLVNGGDVMSSQVSPVFKQLIEMYAVYKAKLKESMVNGVVMHAIPSANVAEIYTLFKEAITNRSKFPQYVRAFNPEGD